MKKLIPVIILLVLVLSVMLTAGCSTAVETPGGTFIEGAYGGDGETLNFLLVSDGTSHSYISHTMDTLVTYNNQLEINLLCLAKDLEVSEDGLVYTATIRDDDG